MIVKFKAGLTLLCLLSLSILLTIYGAWLFYPLEIDYLGLKEIVFMSSEDILANFHILMRYLTLPWIVHLQMPSFSASSAGLHHFEQVKFLFHLTQGVFILTLPVMLSFVKQQFTPQYGQWCYRRYVFAALVPIGLAGIAMLVGFNQFFTLFHQWLFAGDDTWLFNPNTDPVIYILPEKFFLHCFILFFILYEGAVGLIACLCKIKSKVV